MKGPYSPSDHNPILSQRNMPYPRPEIVTCVGHADFVQTPEGDWWAVFLGTRPYERDDIFNTGRETFLLPVKWENESPIILDSGVYVPTFVNKSGLQNSYNKYTGNFKVEEKFEGPDLSFDWIFLRNPEANVYSLGKNGITLQAIPKSIHEIGGNPAYISRRQSHAVFEIETELIFTPLNEGEIAGIACFQNEENNYVFGKTIVNGKEYLILEQTQKTSKILKTIIVPDSAIGQPVKLKVYGVEQFLTFSYSFDGGNSFIQFVENAEARILSTSWASGFQGATLGLYASSNHIISSF